MIADCAEDRPVVKDIYASDKFKQLHKQVHSCRDVGRDPILI